MDIIVVVILVPLIITSGVLLVIDPDGEARHWVDYAITIGFLLSLIFVLAGSCMKRNYSLVMRSSPMFNMI